MKKKHKISGYPFYPLSPFVRFARGSGRGVKTRDCVIPRENYTRGGNMIIQVFFSILVR